MERKPMQAIIPYSHHRGAWGVFSEVSGTAVYSIAQSHPNPCDVVLDTLQHGTMFSTPCEEHVGSLKCPFKFYMRR